MPFHLQLLGQFTIESPGNVPSADKLNRKTRAILAYLAATGQSQARQTLADWFCQEAKDPAGTLRWHLSQIRRKISPELLDVSRDTAVINPDIIQSDHTQFAEAIENLPATTTAALATAVALYRGPFLAGLALANAPEFELWQVGERSRYQRLYEKGAAVLATRYIRQKKYQDALGLAQKVLQQNPLLETMHMQLIWLYAQTGQRQAALHQFAHCRDLLWQELAVEPMAELHTLHQAIVQNKPLPSILPAATPTPPLLQAESARFIGRSEELEKLKALWHNGTAVVLIDGPSGRGKTRLVQAFGRRLPANVPQLAGRSYESTRTIPYYPWQTILQQQVRHLGEDTVAQLAPYWREQLGLLLPELGETAGSLNQQQLFRAITHLLLGLDPQPRLLFVDDLQWADEVSLQLFQFVAQQLAHAADPVLLIGAFRSEEAIETPTLQTLLSDLNRLPYCTRLTLPPFAEAETEQLIATLWQELPAGFRSPHIRDTLLQATDGNPLYMTEILQELTLAQELPTDLPLPPSLAALIGRRLVQLPDDGRQIIESLAILDRPAPFALVQQVSARSEEETITAVEKGLHWRLLRLQDDNQIDFSHDLMRTAVLQQLSPIRQQRLHRRAARTLAQIGAEAAAIATHWHCAGEPEKEAEFAVAAARKAAQLYAIDEAVAFYQRAIPHLPDASKKLEAMRQLARLYQRISAWERAQQVLADGLAIAPPGSADAAHCQILLGQLYSRQSHYQRALDILQAAHAICQQIEDPDLLAQCVGTMGIVHFFRDAFDESRVCYEQALVLAQAQKDEENVAIWLSNIATIDLQIGQAARALTHLQQAVAVHKRLGNQEQTAVALGNVGDIYRQLGEYSQAVAHHLEAVQIRHEWGDRAGVATNLRDLGIDYAEVGQSAAALTCLWQALTLDVALARRDACGISLGHIGCLLAQQGAWEAAVPAVETAVALLRLTHSRYYLCFFLLEMINLLWPQSNWPRLATLLDEATQLARAIGQMELFLNCRITAVHLQAAQQKITAAAAVETLMELPTEDEAQKAVIGYAIWQMDPENETWRRETAVRYQKLHEQSPQEKYRQRFAALTGDELPALPDLPVPPALVTPPGTTLSAYHDQLQSFLSN